MPDMPLDRPWWPPDPEAPIGELVAVLKPSIGPVVDAAAADARARAGVPGALERDAEPAGVLATRTLAAGMASLSLGTVDQRGIGDAIRTSIQLLRDGRRTWRRD